MASGTGASAGIGIGKVVILKEEALVIRRDTVADAAAEKERFKKAVERASRTHRPWLPIWQRESEKKKLRF